MKTIWPDSYDGDSYDGDNNDSNNNDGDNNAKSKHMGFEVMPWAFQNCAPRPTEVQQLDSSTGSTDRQSFDSRQSPTE